MERVTRQIEQVYRGFHQGADYSFRIATPGDVPAIVALLESSLGAGSLPRTVAFWRWKHQEGPFGASPVLLAEHERELVALRAFMRWSWMREGRAVPTVRAVDTVTRADHRGKGLFTRLTRAMLKPLAEEGVSFVFNTPNTKSRPGYLKMGWRSLGRCSLMVLPWRPVRVLVAGARRLRAGEAPVSSLVYNQDVEAQGLYELLEWDGLDALLDSGRSGSRNLTTAVSKAYLQWRYGSIPGITYGAVSRLAHPRVSAAVIYRLSDRGLLRELRVCEVLAPSTQTGIRAVARLLRQLVVRLKPDVAFGIGRVHSAAGAAMLLSAFVPAPRLGPILTVRDLADTAPRRQRMFSSSLGDMEIF